ncbi:MAG TPA: DUF3291 domain-containing protein [Rhodanobacteraceae bacterium]|nr:DUF3291 domain-containing protein [Rhodanobacteraceae bacterium]
MDIGVIKGTMDSPITADFKSSLGRINARAEQSPGFVWRLQTDDGDVELMRRRREWFERMEQRFLVLWWIQRGHVPTVAEALERLQRLRAGGPTPQAFTFRSAFPPPPTECLALAEECPAT